MRIGELARVAGVDVDTIRYYERSGLLPSPARAGNGYRVYGERERRQLAFIRHCRTLDMALADIRELLALADHPTADCDEINRLLAAHLHHLHQKIAALTALEKQVGQLAARCARERKVADCGILHELMAAAEGSACVCHSPQHKPGK